MCSVASTLRYAPLQSIRCVQHFCRSQEGAVCFTTQDPLDPLPEHVCIYSGLLSSAASV